MSVSSIEFNSLQMQKRIQSKIDSEVKKIVKAAEKEIPQKLTLIKQEIFGSFQAIALTEVQRVFLETYGANYDVGSLNQSIIFSMGNDLRPDFSYNINVFQFTSSLKRNTRAFNQNAKQQSTYSSFMQELDFNSFEEEDIYYDDNPFDSAFNSINNSISDSDTFNPHNKVNRQRGFASLTETYEKARTAALESFENQYQRLIKPNIKRKYNITLD